MSNQLNFQPTTSAETASPAPAGDLPQEDLELGLSESVGFTVKEKDKGETVASAPAAPAPSAEVVADPPPLENAGISVPSGTDLGLSESVGFTQRVSEKDPPIDEPAPLPLPPVAKVLPPSPPAAPSVPPRPHPTNRLERAWASMPPVEVAPKPSVKSSAKPSKKSAAKKPATTEEKPQLQAESASPKPIVPTVKDVPEPPPLPIPATVKTEPVLPPTVPASAAAPVSPVFSAKAAPAPERLVVETEIKPAGTVTPEQIEALRGQILHLQIWAWSATVLSVILLILLWAIRPPSAFHPPVETPPATTAS